MATLTRRQFLQTAAATGVGVALHGPVSATTQAPAPASERIGMLVDVTRCIGCRACVRACDDRNELPLGPATTVWDGHAETLRYDQWTTVNFEGSGAQQAQVPVKRQCLHCLEPACASVCPVGALDRLPNGAVIWKGERCIGCRYCVFACPFSMPKFQWDSATSPVIGKCQFCAQQAVFTGAACERACPTGALKFGRRDELLIEARARIQARPDRYTAHVYGEHEVGGTAWLYLADRPFDRLGFPTGLPRLPLPSLTWMALKVIPAVITTVLCALGVLSYGFRRRHQPPPTAA